MVQAGIAEIVLKAVFRKEGVHFRHGGGLVVEGAEVHDLDAEALVYGQEFRAGALMIAFSCYFML